MRDIGIGAPVRRVEDLRFLRGAGRFVDDIAAPGAAHLHVLRSPHAAARIAGIDAAAARAMPGVLLVLTAADLDIPARLRCVTPRHRRDGSPLVQPPWRVLPADAVRHVGDAVAAVVATTPAAAQDAAERIEVDLRAAARRDRPGRGGAARRAGGLAGPRTRTTNASISAWATSPRWTRAFARAAQVVALDSASAASRPTRWSRATRWRCTTRSRTATRCTPARSCRIVMRNEIAEFALERARQPAADRLPRCRRRLRHEGEPLPRTCAVLLAARSGSAGRCAGPRRGPRASSATAMRRDNVSTAELALAADGDFLGLRVAHAGQHGRLPRLAGAGARRPTTSAAWPASTARRISARRSRGCSPTPSRPRPIAAPGGRRRSMRSSG